MRFMSRSTFLSADVPEPRCHTRHIGAVALRVEGVEGVVLLRLEHSFAPPNKMIATPSPVHLLMQKDT